MSFLIRSALVHCGKLLLHYCFYFSQLNMRSACSAAKELIVQYSQVARETEQIEMLVHKGGQVFEEQREVEIACQLYLIQLCAWRCRQIKKLFIMSDSLQQDSKMGIFWQQFSTIMGKNYRLYWRKRIFLYDFINVIVIFAMILSMGYTSKINSVPTPVFLCLAILMHCRNIVLAWVSEKQKRHRDVQLTMGTSSRAYQASWISYFILNGIVISVTLAALLSTTNFYSLWGVGPALMTGLYFLYMLASVSFCLCLANLFSDSNFACQIITLTHILLSFLYNIINLGESQYETVILVFASIFPIVCFEYTFSSFSWYYQTSYNLPYSTNIGLLTLSVQIVFYFTLSFYMDAVMPRKNGSQEHPLFFLKRFTNQKKPSQLEDPLQLSAQSAARFYQAAAQHQRVRLAIKGLTKSFNSRKVLKEITLSFYEGEIFCLLGHNGAGKSTILNIISGFLYPDKGLIKFNDSENDQRKFQLGICLQSSVLYGQLTVREQIDFYARLKGVPSDQLENESKSMMSKCAIGDVEQTRVKHLSGGTWRKVCLACAAVGDSQTLILDEPTSKLDPASRRQVWALIKRLKEQGRTVIMTTQHFDEAEYLADRIGIMAQGELAILGSPSYIKERFGCGYNLEVALSPFLPFSAQKTIVRSQVSECIRGAVEDHQSGKSTMKFKLPFDQQLQYAELFERLQQDGITFSLAPSRIEDIFIKLGSSVDSLFDNQPLPVLERVSLPDFEPNLSFLLQVRAVFMVKFRTTIRSKPQMLSMLLLNANLVFGVVFLFQFGSNYNPASEDDQLRALTVYYQLVYTGYYLSLAFSFSTANLCGFVVRQRQSKWRYLSLVSGLSRKAYWVGSLSFDFLVYLIPLMVVYIIAGGYSLFSHQFKSTVYGWLALLFVTFAANFVTFTYLCGFAFTRSHTAYHFYPYFIFLIFFVIANIPISMKPSWPAIQWLMPLLSPFIGLQCGMLSQQVLGQKILQQFANNEEFLIVSTCEYTFYPICTLSGQCLLFFCITLWLDMSQTPLTDKQTIRVRECHRQQSHDLIMEKKRIKDLQETQPIVVQQLYKKYPNGTIAIRDNSFVVTQGQTLGLLGPNGAGKSTTFNLLTSAVPKTQGRVELYGKQAAFREQLVITKVGICPESNTLSEGLTVEEHIAYFAKIKGLSGARVRQVVEFYLKHMQIDAERGKNVKDLSEGNKRKVCVAMALVGNPSLVFLDEPSSQMDPIARRYLWNLVHSASFARERAIVLTTHSISQADSLCDRIGIMIDGEFNCLDTPQALKQRHSKGYLVNLRCSSQEQRNQAELVMNENIPWGHSQRYECEYGLTVRLSPGQMAFSKLFRLLSELKSEEIIDSFQVSQTNLQQVFLQVSNKAPKERLSYLSNQNLLQQECDSLRAQLNHREQQSSQQLRLLNKMTQQIGKLQCQLSQSRQAQSVGSLFVGGFIFGQDSAQQRVFLIQQLQQMVGRIESTMLIYRLCPHNTQYAHDYIANHSPIVVIVKTATNRLIAIYSHPMIFMDTDTAEDVVLSLWSHQKWKLKSSHYKQQESCLVFAKQLIKVQLRSKRLIVDNHNPDSLAIDSVELMLGQRYQWEATIEQGYQWEATIEQVQVYKLNVVTS